MLAQELHQVETSGFGSDTDPGISGGYGDTGTGNLGNESPEPISDEPAQPQHMRALTRVFYQHSD